MVFEKTMDKLSDEFLQLIYELGEVPGDDYLDIGRLLNKKPTPNLIRKIGLAMAEFFHGRDVDSLVTIDSSGNPLACVAAVIYYELYEQELPILYIKKSARVTDSDNLYTAEIVSPTSGESVTLAVDKKYVKDGETYGLVDDFLFRGDTFGAAREILEEGGAEVDSAFFVVNKMYANDGLPEGFDEDSAVYLAGVEDHFSSKDDLAECLRGWGYLEK